MHIAGEIRRIALQILGAPRSLTELKNEIESLGLELPTIGYGRKELEEILKRYYWQKDHPGARTSQICESSVAAEYEGS